MCDSSTVGSTPPCQGGGREFEPRLSLQEERDTHSVSRSFAMSANRHKMGISHVRYVEGETFLSLSSGLEKASESVYPKGVLFTLFVYPIALPLKTGILQVHFWLFRGLNRHNSSFLVPVCHFRAIYTRFQNHPLARQSYDGRNAFL